MSEPNLNDILSSGGLSSLLQNPEVAAKLPRIMEALAPVISEMRAEQSATSSPDSAAATKEELAPEQNDAVNAVAKVLPALTGDKKNSPAARRRALLRALEPYLSDNRREVMDYIGKALSLIDILSEVM